MVSQVRRLDAQLDRIPFNNLAVPEGDFAIENASELSTPRVKELLRIIKALSGASAARPVLPSGQLTSLLAQSSLLGEPTDDLTVTQYETELEWLLVSKATVQSYGVIMDTLLDQIIPLSDHIWYWDDVLSSPASSSLYMMQTSPLRFWGWTKEIYEATMHRLQRGPEGQGLSTAESTSATIGTHVAHSWRRFYGVVQESIRERSLVSIQRRVMSPVALCRAEARGKQAQLKKLREMTSSGLGVLIDEGLVFSANGSDDSKSDIILSGRQHWKGVVERSVALMDMILRDILALEISVADFEDKVFAGVDEDPELSIHVEEDDCNRPAVVAKRLHRLLETLLPDHLDATRRLVQEHGRPSRMVRYWLPATALLLSSTTILRILVRRQQDIIDWVADFGATLRGFWFNWVVEPTRKVISTIRHDANSEIAIMSRDSLESDRESLERMVVDFALDQPASATGQASLSESQVADIRAKVKEGDLTPILRAYEKDLRKPLMGVVRGDLIRTLLIQVQKTKVDVEVAMAGIDTLLRSQELVFGFVGLTPGVMVSIAVVQYLRGVFGGRRGFRQDRQSGKCIRVLRNIDRIFSETTPSPNNVLPYKDHGLLVCEVHMLRRLALTLLPTDVVKDFLEDLDDLANLKGIQSQLRALDRIRWAYSKWLR